MDGLSHKLLSLCSWCWAGSFRRSEVRSFLFPPSSFQHSLSLFFSHPIGKGNCFFYQIGRIKALDSWTDLISICHLGYIYTDPQMTVKAYPHTEVEVVRVERWQRRIITAWMIIRQQMVYVICVYGPQTGRTVAEKEAFREEVERLACLSDGQTMLCVAGDSNAHIVTSVWLSQGTKKA